MRNGCIVALVALLAGACSAGGDPRLDTDEQKTLYALGIALSRNVSPFNLTADELKLVQAGFADGVLGKEKKVDLDTFGPKIQQLATTRAASTAAAEKKGAEAFVAKAAGEKGATKTASGMIITEIRPGTGETPKATDKVKVHYHGTLIDGTVFDSSVQRGEPITLALNGVIRCWTEGVSMMKVGGKSRLICPPDLAYGDRGAPPTIKPGATLVFEVELLEIVR